MSLQTPGSHSNLLRNRSIRIQVSLVALPPPTRHKGNKTNLVQEVSFLDCYALGKNHIRTLRRHYKSLGTLMVTFTDVDSKDNKKPVNAFRDRGLAARFENAMESLAPGLNDDLENVVDERNRAALFHAFGLAAIDFDRGLRVFRSLSYRC